MRKRFVLAICTTLCALAVGSANAANVTLSDGSSVDSSRLVDTGVALRYTGANTAFQNADGSGRTGIAYAGNMPYYGDPTKTSLILTGITDTDTANTWDSFDPDNSWSGAGVHSIMELSWLGKVLSNTSGNDFQIGEQGSLEGILASVKVTGGSWTGWLWAQQYITVSSNGFGNWDLTNFGVADGATIEAIRLTQTVGGQTQDDFGNTIHGDGAGGLGFTLGHCDADPTYVAALHDTTAAPVPEPGGLLSLGVGAMGFLGYALRRRLS